MKATEYSDFCKIRAPLVLHFILVSGSKEGDILGQESQHGRDKGLLNFLLLQFQLPNKVLYENLHI